MKFKNHSIPKLDWVKIPTGEFQSGLNTEHQGIILQKARIEANCNEWSDEEKNQIEEYINLLREQILMKPSIKATSKPFIKSREILSLQWKYPQLLNLFRVESVLALQLKIPIIQIRSFYISRFPITFEQGDAFFNAHGQKGLSNRRNKPPEMINGKKAPEAVEWRVADMFCHWLGGRLPTSIEWEYAARGSAGLLYPWGNEWDVFRGNFAPQLERPEHLKNVGMITPIDAYPGGVSPFGVWDMLGNYAEWTIDLLPDSHGLAARFKGQLLNDCEKPSWFWYLPELGGAQSIDLEPWYVGFRPVKDQWHNQLWPGFK